MLVAIISDIHDNEPNLEKCLAWCRAQKIKKIIFCGDATALRTMKNLAAYEGEIFSVLGNMELYEESELKRFKNIRSFGKSGNIEIDGKKIGFVHESFRIASLLKSGDLDYIFYGHSHKPWLEKKGRTAVANPGNLAGVWYPATFAVLDTVKDGVELKILSEI